MDGDPHVLEADHLPTPFTAEEIRANSHVGRTVRALVVRGGESSVRIMRIVAVSPEGWERESWTESMDGRRLSEPELERSTWLELQAHASMPAATTRIDEETIEIPAGRFDCLRYSQLDGESLDTFWFATSEPGAPVRFEKRIGHELLFSFTTIEISRT